MKIDDFAWMWQGIAKRTASTQDTALLKAVDIRGDGQKHAILLLHGFSSSPAVFRTLLPHLNHYDGIFIPALPGHAQSIEAFSNTSAQAWLDYTHTYCQQLTQQYERVDVLGLSLGGLLACHLSQHLPLHHLYLLAPAFYLNVPIKPALFFLQVLQNIGIRSIRNRAGNIHHPEHEELAYRRLPLSVIKAILTLIKTTPFIPPRCPTDLFLGCHDAVLNNMKIMKLFQSLPHTTIHWLKHSAHVLPLDADYPQIVRTIQRHL
ncbi:MAG: alpha/beta fold hydrolase [Gammaproteobacteria bacterium]|nr:alpha/beta fold hydrolase [Gammaproteobacteria bacterium]